MNFHLSFNVFKDKYVEVQLSLLLNYAYSLLHVVLIGTVAPLPRTATEHIYSLETEFRPKCHLTTLNITATVIAIPTSTLKGQRYLAVRRSFLWSKPNKTT
jgi:hypothetical protein